MDHIKGVTIAEERKGANGIGGGIEVGGGIGHGNGAGGENGDVSGDGAEPERERDLRGRRTKEHQTGAGTEAGIGQ